MDMPLDLIEADVAMFMLEPLKAPWFQEVSEARVDPAREQVLRDALNHERAGSSRSGRA